MEFNRPSSFLTENNIIEKSAQVLANIIIKSSEELKPWLKCA